MARILLILSTVLFLQKAQANSCCGQSPASFTVLSLSQTLSLSTGFSYLQSQGRVYEDSQTFYVWKDKKRKIQSILFNAASSFSDRHQIFINGSLQQGIYRDSFEEGKSTHWTDTLMGYTYELFPEYSYSVWRPILYLTALLNVPTGHSIYDSNRLSEGGDVTGHGQWGTGLGLTLRKVYFPWTLTLQGKSLRLFDQNFGGTQVSGFYDNSLAFLVNHASPWWGLQGNMGLTFNHLSQRTLQPTNITSGRVQNFTVLAGLQKSLSESWVVGLNYSDQTLVGPAKNSLLNRSLSLTFNFNYF